MMCMSQIATAAASLFHSKFHVPTQQTCRNLSVKICIGKSNKVKTSDKQMHVRYCDNSFYCKISSDKLERWSDKLIGVKSVGKCFRGLALRRKLNFNTFVRPQCAEEWSLYLTASYIWWSMRSCFGVLHIE